MEEPSYTARKCKGLKELPRLLWSLPWLAIEVKLPIRNCLHLYSKGRNTPTAPKFSKGPTLTFNDENAANVVLELTFPKLPFNLEKKKRGSQKIHFYLFSQLS